MDIISISFGLRHPTAQEDLNREEKRLLSERYIRIVDDIEEAIRNATFQAPRIIFAAASNNGKNDPRAFPANCEQVICVHASEGNGEDGAINPEAESGFNFMTLGMGIELMERVLQPGKKFPKYRKVIRSGTSFATPIAAGIAATVLDLASRVEAINGRTNKKLRRREGMEKMLRMMSTPKSNDRGQLHYMAPWHHWKSGWEMDAARSRWFWDSINEQFRV